MEKKCEKCKTTRERRSDGSHVFYVNVLYPCDDCKCNHTVGMYYDYCDNELVPESELVTDPEKRWENFYVEDVSFFQHCPDCGVKLPYKEKYDSDNS